jgi:hypothetical protein
MRLASPQTKSKPAHASSSPLLAAISSPMPASKHLGLTQKEIAAELGVSIARVSQIEHGEVTSFEVIARYVEALGGRPDLVADFGDHTVRLLVSDTSVSMLPGLACPCCATVTFAEPPPGPHAGPSPTTRC